jgi:hypothetical protein
MPIKDPIARRENHKRYMKEVWYPKNRKKHQELVAKTKVIRRQERAKIISEYKIKCSRCPENHPAALDFHHRNPKEKLTNIAFISSLGWSKENLIKEIEKCDVICSNCHRKLHYEEKLAG